MRKIYLLLTSLIVIFSCSKEEPTPPPPTKYNVSISLNPTDGGTVSPNGGQFNEGQTVSFTVTPSENYIFKNWSGSNTSSNNPLSLTINSNKTLTVNFEKKDTDGDGVTDDVDQCPDTPSGEDVDDNGCSDSQKDSDGDGVMDNLDLCEDTYINETVGNDGCSIYTTFGFNNYSSGNDIDQTLDNGFIVVGNTYFNDGNDDVYLIKINSSGNLEWERTLGGDRGDYGYSIEQTIDGGYIITGSTKSLSGNTNLDVYLVKTDNLGNIQWEKTLGTINDDEGYSGKQTIDGGYIVFGYSKTHGGDILLIKTDENGDLVWIEEFGGPGFDYGYSGQQTQDGGYILTGYTNSNEENDTNVILIKTDDEGNLEWEKQFSNNKVDMGLSVIQTSDGGYTITGKTNQGNTNFDDLYIIRTDSNGTKIWEKTHGGDYNEVGYSIEQTIDGGYIITGSTSSFGDNIENNNQDVYLIKVSEDGSLEWSKYFGGRGNDIGNNVIQTIDSGYIIVGSTDKGDDNPDSRVVYLIKTDENGSVEW